MEVYDGQKIQGASQQYRFSDGSENSNAGGITEKMANRNIAEMPRSTAAENLNGTHHMKQNQPPCRHNL
jgi:hypothetical protein